MIHNFSKHWVFRGIWPTKKGERWYMTRYITHQVLMTVSWIASILALPLPWETFIETRFWRYGRNWITVWIFARWPRVLTLNDLYYVPEYLVNVIYLFIYCTSYTCKKRSFETRWIIYAKLPYKLVCMCIPFKYCF